GQESPRRRRADGSSPARHVGRGDAGSARAGATQRGASGGGGGARIGARAVGASGAGAGGGAPARADLDQLPGGFLARRVNAAVRPGASAARAIARPASTCAVAGRSLAGVTTTTGTGGSLRPPMNHNGMSTPQSIGATADDRSLPPKLMPTDGISAST